jgi:hypothetical protein
MRCIYILIPIDDKCFLQIFEASPRLKRAMQHHEFKREEESKMTEQKIFVRPKTAPKRMTSVPSKPASEGTKSLIGVQNENESCRDTVGIAVLSVPY